MVEWHLRLAATLETKVRFLLGPPFLVMYKRVKTGKFSVDVYGRKLDWRGNLVDDDPRCFHCGCKGHTSDESRKQCVLALKKRIRSLEPY